jgi:hypothetical protein
MTEDEDPIVGSGGANKPESETKADNADSALPSPRDDDAENATGKHRHPDND